MAVRDGPEVGNQGLVLTITEDGVAEMTFWDDGPGMTSKVIDAKVIRWMSVL